jgi:hypothetical protein
MTAEYEGFASRYATREARRTEHSIGGDSVWRVASGRRRIALWRSA